MYTCPPPPPRYKPFGTHHLQAWEVNIFQGPPSSSFVYCFLSKKLKMERSINCGVFSHSQFTTRHVVFELTCTLPMLHPPTPANVNSIQSPLDFQNGNTDSKENENPAQKMSHKPQLHLRGIMKYIRSWNKVIYICSPLYVIEFTVRGTQRQFLENIFSEDDLRSRIFGTFVVKYLACLPLLRFSNI